MGQQVPQRRRPEARLRRDQPVGAQIVAGRCVQVDQSLLAQLHDGDRGHGLGDRGDPEDGVFVHRRARFGVGDTVPVEPGQGPATDHAYRQSRRWQSIQDPDDSGMQLALSHRRGARRWHRQRICSHHATLAHPAAGF